MVLANPGVSSQEFCEVCLVGGTLGGASGLLASRGEVGKEGGVDVAYVFVCCF